MATLYRLAWYDPNAQTPDVPGHPLYVAPRQGAGRIDDPQHEYRVLYLNNEAAGCVGEVFGDFAIWTPALLDPPPNLPQTVRAIVEYDVGADLCDLDDPKRLVEYGLRPSQVVGPDRSVSQRWARQIYEAGQYDGISWWSRRDARWASAGLWNHTGVNVTTVTILGDLAAEPITEAAAVLLRRVGR